MESAHAIESLYYELLTCWNKADAKGFANLFANDGTAVGFDGSTHIGRTGIEHDLTEIFSKHQVASFLAIVRESRLLTYDIGLLRATVGMVPPGADDIKPEVNAVQVVIACRGNTGEWKIAHFQNTPAAFHGRQEQIEKLTGELRKAYKERGVVNTRKK
jgi:uncharacterized protein (TIGR02246 family)